MIMILLVIVIILKLELTVVESARILAFTPNPYHSHQKVIQPLIVELALRGHNVTSVTTFPLDNPPANYRTIRVDNYVKYKRFNMLSVVYYAASIFAPIYFLIYREYARNLSEWVFQQKPVQDLIASNEEFDLIIMESVMAHEAYIGLAHRFNAPVIDYMVTGNVLWNYWLLGNPYDTSYIVDTLLNYSHEMTFSQRLYLTMVNAFENFIAYYYGLARCQATMDRNLKYPGWQSRPPIQDLISNISLTLINTHHSFNYPYPYSPNFIEVGGLHMEKAKPMSKDIQRLMDEAENGVILFSLGSQVEMSHLLSDELRTALIQVFSELNLTVLWKWENEFPHPQPSTNVILGKWFPQQQILGHKNLKLFISHGGLLSITESIAYGVPIISIPLFGDHFRNAEILTYYNCGLTLNFFNLTYRSLNWSVHEILHNPKYALNAKMRSTLFHDRPETALETAVYWSEYVLRHKGAHHLKPALSTMSWYQQTMIDVYAALAAITLLLAFVFCKIIKCIALSVLSKSCIKREISDKKNK